MFGSAKQGWVWHSSEESHAAGQISVLAVLETLICVTIYWALLLLYGVTLHHWIILIATPLVLFRSEQSVTLGVKWFRDYRKGEATELHFFLRVVLYILSCAACGLAAWFLATSWLVGEMGWLLFVRAMAIGWLSANIAMAVSGALVGWKYDEGLQVVVVVVAVQVAVMVVGVAMGAGTSWVAAVVAVAGAAIGAAALVPLRAVAVAGVTPGYGVGVWLRAIVIRLAATTRFLIPGLMQFPRNWRVATTVSDLFHRPELIPGDTEYTYGGRFSYSIKYPDGSKRSMSSIVAILWIIPIFFGPAVLWRWSIKSTAWFYLPLLWVGRGWRRLEDDELQIWANSYSSKFLNWLWLITGGLSFAFLAITLFSFQKWYGLQLTLDEAGAPMTPLGLLFSLEWGELLKQPWLWLYIPSYMLTIFIFFALDDIAKDIRHGAAPQSRAILMKRWMWAANARAFLTNIGLAVSLWYFLAAVDAWEKTKAFWGGSI